MGWTIGWKDKKDDVELLIGPEVLARDKVQGLVALCGAITIHPRYDPVSKGRLNVYLTEEELMRDDDTELLGKGMEGNIVVPEGWL